MSLPLSKPPPSLPDLVSRYAAGASLRELGALHGVSHRTIYLWLLSGLGDQAHADLVTQCLVNRIAEADEELDTAEDHLSISRAREKMRYSRMDFERRRPNLYGPKQEVKHTGQQPVLNITVTSPSDPKLVIDQE